MEFAAALETENGPIFGEHTHLIDAQDFVLFRKIGDSTGGQVGQEWSIFIDGAE
jgi:hypothetical protein